MRRTGLDWFRTLELRRRSCHDLCRWRHRREKRYTGEIIKGKLRRETAQHFYVYESATGRIEAYSSCKRSKKGSESTDPRPKKTIVQFELDEISGRAGGRSG